MTRSPVGTPIRERIARLVIISPETGCWLWQGRITSCGYGQMSLPGRRKGYAHRVSYETFVGPISTALAVDHRCEVKACVNPAHLEAVSYGENTRRWWASRKSAEVSA